MDNVLEKILDVECSAYGFKEAVEKKKTKSWLKSISAFANTKAELHPEFTSEANVFYTTIKNVNYPPKDEKWVVKVGSSDAKVGSSADNMGSSFPKNQHLVDIYGPPKRLSRKKLSENILQFCSDWRTPDNISVYTGKELRYIKEKVLPQMIKSGLLERLYPETPNHPKQKYRAAR